MRSGRRRREQQQLKITKKSSVYKILLTASKESTGSLHTLVSLSHISPCFEIKATACL